MDDLIKMIFDGNLITEEQFKSISTLKKPYGERVGSLLVNRGFLTSEVLEKFFKENTDYLFGLFQEWLSANSKIVDAIIWWEDGSKENPHGVPKAYPDWSHLKKTQLSSTFWKILLDLSPGLNETPPCTVNLYENGKVFSTEFKPDIAWKYYLAYVAHSLSVEMGGLVHWSLSKYNKEQLELLLDGRSLFEYFESRQVYAILRWHGLLFNHGSATPGDPVRIYDFLIKEKLVGINRWDSMGRFLSWCRKNLYHFTGENTKANYQDHWQYEGFPPVERIISGTEHPTQGFKHFTAGCWGTTGFIRTVLRTINIPVTLEERCGHALPHFAYDVSHQVYLSHGDDPYHRLYKASKIQFPPTELLINRYKFDEWFDKNLPQKTICNNVGMRALELVVEYIPNEILKIHCDDLSHGRTPEEGRLYQKIFKDHISFEELKAFGFWDRIEEKIEKSGGCKNLL